MSKFIIKGGAKLKGEIKVNGAKNAALKIIPASLLSSEKITISNVPDIEDIDRSLELIEHLGGSYERDGNTLTIKTETLANTNIDADMARKIRTSTLYVGPLLARKGQVKMCHPGGDVIGKRPIDLFIDGFRKFGVEVNESHDSYEFKTKGLKGMTYVFPRVSVTVTEALLITAVLAEGTTYLKNAAMEPEIVALAEYLNKCGAKITGAGTPTIKIEGVASISADKYEIIPDRVEAGSFAIMGALAAEELKVTNCRPDHLEALWTMFDKMGVDYELGEDWVLIRGGKPLKAADVITHEYPGFITDIQPPFAVLLTQAEGLSMVHETVFEGRLFYTDKLNKMGANIIMCDPHRVIVSGPSKLYGTRLASPDIRAGFALILAGLVAEGTTEIDNIYQIDRGYEKVEQRLKNLGANIERQE
jgi:UDP-N-acetylglucosamine 1-carboxyvinyltransferase